MSPVRPIPLPIHQLPGISRRQLEEHYKLYLRYIEKIHEIRQLLPGVDRAGANPTYSPFRELKVAESFASNAVTLHEFYFTNLGGPGGRPTGALLAQLVRDYGSRDNWEYDFVSTGKAARGWAVLCWDFDARQLRNCLADSHDLGPIWRAAPLLVLDVYEHAYFMDYGADRSAYIRAFMANINWAEVGRRFACVSSEFAPGPAVPATPLPPPPPAGPGLGSAGEGRGPAKSLPYPYNLRPCWPV
ncbi:MAG: superoxide dismutase [Chloroflexota bacterium]